METYMGKDLWFVVEGYNQNSKSYKVLDFTFDTFKAEVIYGAGSTEFVETSILYSNDVTSCIGGHLFENSIREIRINDKVGLIYDGLIANIGTVVSLVAGETKTTITIVWDSPSYALILFGESNDIALEITIEKAKERSIRKDYSVEMLPMSKSEKRFNVEINSETLSGGDMELEEKRRKRFYQLTKSLKSIFKKSPSKELDINYQSNTLVTLFYGTNRAASPSSKVRYNSKSGNTSLGFCNVSIPPSHLVGNIETPYTYCLLHSAQANKHFILRDVIEKSQEDFCTWMNQQLQNVMEKSALIFLHGYNVSFADAAFRTAQIAHVIPFKGVAGFFSWPSPKHWSSYAADIERADSSVPEFEKFLRIVIEETKVQKIHLIAHSMGNRILTVALNNLQNTPLASQLDRIRQIVLAAPDIDQEVFLNSILPRFKDVGKNRTLYTSQKDKALKISRRLRGGRPRLGDSGRSIFLADGLDTIDASNIPSRGNHHSYIFDTRELLSDLYYLIDKELEPTERRLRPIVLDGRPYWLFPK
jgi:esterase/lipase superfamily enzyme